ncbi:peptidoglycan-binding domain-containing protein [Aeromonas rivipollensis]
MGPATKKALLEFQEMKNLPNTGALDPKTVKALGIEPTQKFPNLGGDLH